MPPIVAQPLSPLLQALQEQILPAVQEKGMSSIAVAHATWQTMEATGEALPEGFTVTPKPLKSQRTPVGGPRKYVDACWPEDGLHSNIAPTLMFVVRGRVAIQLGDYVLHCRQGHGILTLPGTPYPDGSHLCHEDEEGCSMLSFRGWGNGMECWINHTQGEKHWSHCSVGENCHVLYPQARIYLETLAEEARVRAPQYRVLCDGLIQVFIALVVRGIQEMRAFQPIRRSGTSLDKAGPQPVIEKSLIAYAEDFVHNNLHTELSIDNVASHVHMSRSHFTRQFRQETGQTFNEYVTQRRLEAAKALLESTDWPIEKISQFVGVTSARLRMLFAKNTQLTPGEFRRRNWSQ